MKQSEDTMQGPLADYEFRFSGHRLRVIQPARDTEDQTPLFDYVAPRESFPTRRGRYPEYSGRG